MDVKPINKKNIYEDIVLQIKTMIDGGELGPGDKLPPERRLAEMFSVSRNTVREAIKALAEKNILESRQGAGTFVREAKDDDFAVSFAGAIVRHRPELRDIFEVRKLIEPEIAALAARNASPSEVTLLETVLHEQVMAFERGVLVGNLDHRFHEILAEASGNSVMGAMVSALHAELQECRVMGLQSKDRQRASLVAHRAIVAAIRDGQVMRAEKTMREHLEEVEKIVLSVKE